MEDPMDKEYMEKINREFGHTIFHKNDDCIQTFPFPPKKYYDNFDFVIA